MHISIKGSLCLFAFIFSISVPLCAHAEPSRGLNIDRHFGNASAAEVLPFPTIPAPPAPAKWTLLVYMAADNNLEPFAIQDINELEQGLWLIKEAGLKTTLVDILVLADRAEGYTEAWDDWTDTRLIRIQPDNSPAFASNVLMQNRELNMGDPATLSAFLGAAQNLSASEHTALVLWNHGGGWSNLAHDETTPSGDFGYFHLQDLSDALSQAAVGRARSPFDLIGFDMCLMAQFETATAVQTYADVMIASQALEPGDGWPYAEIIPKLATSDPIGGASAIVEAFHDYYRKRNEPDTTLAAIDLRLLGEFEHALSKLLEKHSDELSTRWATWTQGVFTSESYALLDDEASGQEALQSIDLFALLNYLSQADVSRALRRSLAELKKNLQNLIITHRASPRRANSHGLAVYAPLREQLSNPEYARLEPSGTKDWQRLIQQIHAAQRQSKPFLIFRNVETWNILRDEPVPNIQQLGQDGILAKLDTRNALKLETWLGRPVGNGEIEILTKKIARFFGQSNDARQPVDRMRNESLLGYLIPEGKVEVLSRLDGIGFAVTNGANDADLTLSQTNLVAAERGEYEAPIAFMPKGSNQSFEGVIRFNWLLEAESVAVRVPSPTGVLSYQLIKPTQDDQITFFREIHSAPGIRLEPTKTLPWKQGLVLKAKRLPLGSYLSLLELEDLLGHHEQATHAFELTNNPALTEFLKLALSGTLDAGHYEGDWEIFDSISWFEQGRLQPTGARVHYEPVAGKPGLMIKTLTPPNGIPTHEEAWLTSGALPQVREVLIDANGDVVDLRQVAVSIPALFQSQGLEFIASYDLSTGSLSIKGRPLEKNQPAAGPGGSYNLRSPSGVTALEGIWQSDNGMLFIVRGIEWAITSGQQLVDQGTLFIIGNELTLNSLATGQQLNYRYTADGLNLLATDEWGQTFYYEKISD